MTVTTLFSELPLSEAVLEAVAEMGFESPSPIQAQAIPHLLEGKDVIGQAQTGTGKTAAFGIPIIEACNTTDRSVQALILCPTRELALQVTEEIKKLAKHKRGLLVTTVYGGDSMERQITALKKGTQIVVGTPGRVLDHIKRRNLHLSNVKMAVLDEADEMLDMGFREDIESILAETPDSRQTVFFSATMPKEIIALTRKYQQDPVLVKVVNTELTNRNIEQIYFDVRSRAKTEVMCRLIDVHQLKLMLVFCNTKKKVDELVEELQNRGYQAEGLHGDMRQGSRNLVMNKFRHGSTGVLIATDVAARGIDVSDVDAVFNYDMPLDNEYYVHRIGRTGRAGKLGKAFSLTTGSERNKLRDVERYTKAPIEKGKIPTFEEVVASRQKNLKQQIIENIGAGNLALFEGLLFELESEGYAAHQIVAALAKTQLSIQKNEFSEQNLDGENERQERRQQRGGTRDGGYDRSSSRSSYSDRPAGDRYGSSNRSEGYRREYTSRDNDRREGGERPFRQESQRDSAPRISNDGEVFKRGREQGMTRLFISIGRRAKINPSHIVSAIAGEANIPGRTIGHISIQDACTYVDVPEAHARKVVSVLNGSSIKDRRVMVEIAREQ